MAGNSNITLEARKKELSLLNYSTIMVSLVQALEAQFVEAEKVARRKKQQRKKRKKNRSSEKSLQLRICM